MAAKSAKLLIVAAMTDVGKPDMPTRATRFWYIKLYSHKTILFTQITVIKLLTPTTFVRSVLDTHKGYDQKLENLHFQNFQALFHTKSGGYDLSLAHLQSMWLCDASTSASWRTNKIMWFASTSSRNETTMCIHTSSHYHGYIPEIHPFLQIFWWLDKTTETTQRQTPRHTTNMPFSFSPPASTFFCIICNIVTIF